MQYNPDLWTIVAVTHKEDVYYRVLASWYGGYTRGDSWKLSSSIERLDDFGDHYEANNSSGSVYILPKNNVGMSSYSASVLANLMDECPPEVVMEVVDVEKVKL